MTHFLRYPDETFHAPQFPQALLRSPTRQSTIYPTLLPGGWHILGATPLKLFDLRRPQPSLLLPGDQVRFISISEQEYDRLATSIAQEET